jgi:small-conductance mechanosensitive channel/CRP-like cAMP-binding protein
MYEWLQARGFWEMGGALAAFASLLLVALWAGLPTERRQLLRRPLAVFAVYLVLFGLAQVFPPRHENTAWIRVAALAAVLIVVSRGSVLLATETTVGRWLLPPLPRIFQDVVQGALFAVVGLLTLRAAGLEPGQLLTTSALLTAVVGLALQDTLGNLFSGLALQVGQPFEVGDWIEVDADPARSGRVLEIGWRATKLVTLDESEIIVPNGTLAKATIRNHTRPSTLERRHVVFGAAYHVPPGVVTDVVLAALHGVPDVCSTPTPFVVVTDFGENAVTYDVMYYTNDHRAALITDGAVRRRIWHALARARVPIPFPQRDVHVFTQDAARAQQSSERALESRRAALRSVDLFRLLDRETLGELAGGAETLTYAAGEEVVHQGHYGDTLYVVERGEVEVLVQTDRIAVLGPGAFFGEMSLLTGEARTATVRCLTETTLVTVGHGALHGVLQGHPELYGKLSTVLAERQVAIESHANAGAVVPKHVVEERSTALLRRIRDFFAT